VIEIKNVLAAKRESKRIDFKERFDTQAAGEWCEIIKDIVAMANSGGGAILFGTDNIGKGNRGRRVRRLSTRPGNSD